MIKLKLKNKFTKINFTKRKKFLKLTLKKVYWDKILKTIKIISACKNYYSFYLKKGESLHHYCNPIYMSFRLCKAQVNNWIDFVKNEDFRLKDIEIVDDIFAILNFGNNKYIIFMDDRAQYMLTKKTRKRKIKIKKNKK